MKTKRGFTQTPSKFQRVQTICVGLKTDSHSSGKRFFKQKTVEVLGPTPLCLGDPDKSHTKKLLGELEECPISLVRNVSGTNREHSTPGGIGRSLHNEIVYGTQEGPF